MKKIILVLGVILLTLCKTGHSAWYSTEQIANYQFDPITRSIRITPSTSAVFNVSGSSIIAYQGGQWRIIESTGMSYQGGQWKIVESTNWITGGQIDNIKTVMNVIESSAWVKGGFILASQNGDWRIIESTNWIKGGNLDNVYQINSVLESTGWIKGGNLDNVYQINSVLESTGWVKGGNLDGINNPVNVTGSTVSVIGLVSLGTATVSITFNGSTMTVVNENYKNMVSSGWIVGKFTGVTSATLSITDKVSKYRLLYRNTTNVDQEMNYTATNIFKGGNAEYLVNGIVSEPSIDVPTPIDFNFNSLAVEATIYYRMQTIQPK